jgi:hypothetical protein
VRRARTGGGASGSGTDAHRRRAARPRLCAQRWGAPLIGFGTLLLASSALGKPLDQLIPGLFGGSLSTSVDQSGTDQSRQQVLIVQRFRNLSAQLSVARSQIPIPSSSGAFSYAWDSDLDTFVRFEESLGSLFAERAQTLGRGRFNVGVSYQYVNFSTLDGDPLDNIRSRQPAFTPEYLAGLPIDEQRIFGKDVIDTRLALSFSYDLITLTAAYGLTDSIDLSMALTINRASLSGHALAMTIDPSPPPPPATEPVGVFTANQQGIITNGSGPPICSLFPPRCAQDSIGGTAVGTGDIFLRGKWHFADTRYVDFAVVGILTLPTGNADNFLGFHDPTFTPWLIMSKSFGPIAPHLNLGYSIRSSQDVSQGQWIAGADYMATRWLTLGSDFLGYHDDKGDNVVQSAVEFKVNPFGGMVLSAGFQFPVNREGLRADVIYTGQVEYNF